MTQEAQQATASIKHQCTNFKGDLAIILGSGLGTFADEMQNKVSFSY